MEAVAKLKNVPTSPRKMRLVADLIRGEKVNRALNILKFERREGAIRLEKLLLSAISNWQQRNEDEKLEEADLFVKEIRVDGGRMLKRLRPAPQGRAHRIRKRSNHVTLVISSSTVNGKESEAKEAVAEVAKAETPQKETKKKVTKKKAVKEKVSAKKDTKKKDTKKKDTKKKSTTKKKKS